MRFPSKKYIQKLMSEEVYCLTHVIDDYRKKSEYVKFNKFQEYLKGKYTIPSTKVEYGGMLMPRAEGKDLGHYGRPDRVNTWFDYLLGDYFLCRYWVDKGGKL